MLEFENSLLCCLDNLTEAVYNLSNKEEIEKLQTQLAEANEVIDFYGNKEGQECMWLPKSSSQMNINNTIDMNDMEEVSRISINNKKVEYWIGGKKARGYQKKYKEK